VRFLRWIVAGVVAGILKIGTGFLFHDAIFGASYADPALLAVRRTYPAMMTHMALLSVAAGLLFALLYWTLSRALPGAAALRGFIFGALVWFGVVLAATLSVVLWVNMPAATAWAWILDSLVWCPLAGTLVGLIMGKAEAR
jgi:hypothetical protein